MKITMKFLLILLLLNWANSTMAQNETNFPKDGVVAFYKLTEKPVEIKRVKPEYPRSISSQGIEGILVIKVLVNENGDVEKWEVLKEAHPVLVKYASQAAVQFKFRPAKVDGKAVKVWVSIPFNFMSYSSDINSVLKKSQKLNEKIDKHIKKEKYEQAIKDCKKLIGIYEDFEQKYREKEKKHNQKEKYKKAEIDYWKSTTFTLSLGWKYEMLGKIYREVGDYKAAISAFQTALDINPDNSRFYKNLGWAHYLAGNFKKCIHYSQQALEKNSKSGARFNIPLSYLRLGKVNKAKVLYADAKSFCEKQRFEISEDVYKVLRYLIDQDVMADEAHLILEEVFGLSKSEIINL